MIDIALVVFAYLLGSISSAVLVARAFGLPDPRSEGSGNPGATNMLRVGGRWPGLLTLMGDILKGLIAVGIAHGASVTAIALAAVVLAVVIGHLYPVFFGFRGGKGVATTLGALTALHWPAGLSVAATWIGMAIVTKISSLSALVAIAVAPLWVWWWTKEPAWIVVTTLLAALLIWRHRSNIRNLVSGTEGRIGGN